MQCGDDLIPNVRSSKTALYLWRGIAYAWPHVRECGLDGRYRRPGCWDMGILSQHLPPLICSTIVVIPTPRVVDSADTVVWGGSKDGEFSLSSACSQITEERSQSSILWKKIWKVQCPQKNSSFSLEVCSW